MKPATPRALLAIFLAVALLTPLTLAEPARTGHAAGPTILHVKAGAPPDGDGLSWSKAFATLQEALDQAADADPDNGITYEIWMTAGTYYPTKEYTPGNPDTRTFEMRNGVAIYGGFPADATDGVTTWIDRDWERHQTILSGAGPDNPIHFSLFYHTPDLGLDETAVLDGVTLTGADNSFGDGGGMYNHTASPTLRNVIITGNSAHCGGGMYNGNASPTLHNVIITGNSAAYGGGMCNSGASPTLRNVFITGNSADNGGGMYNYNSSPTLENVTIQYNEADHQGGGIYNGFHGNPTLSGVVLTWNKALDGGGMYNRRSSPVIDRTVISANEATQVGGGMYNHDASHPTLTNVLISGNKAPLGGGMFNRHFSNSTLTNVTIVGNLVTTPGGEAGGGILIGSNSSVVVRNSIIIGNGFDDGAVGDNVYPADTVTATHSLIGTAPAGGYQEAKNFFRAPAPISSAPTADGDYRLNWTATDLIDQGNDEDITTSTDLAGEPRFRGTVDLGAYEYQGRTNADLRSLAVDNTPLHPFDPSKTLYQLQVPAATSSVTVTAVAADTAATIELDTGGGFATIRSGVAGGPIPLATGVNTIVVRVTAEDDFTVKEYVLEIQRVRATPSPPVTRPDPPGDPTPPTFSDIASHWAEDHIMTAAASNLVSGYPDGTFRPDAPITRAEFVVMLVNALKLDGAGAAVSFADWDKVGAWAQPAIQLAVQAGMVRGYEDGTFRPDAHITRTEMAVMIARALRLGGAQATATGFADDTHIPSWAKAAVAALRELGTVTGRDGNNFAPHDLATRAEAVVMLLRMLESRPAQ